MVNTSVFWSYGCYLIRHSAGKMDKLLSKDTAKHIFTAPPFVAFLVAMLLAALNITLPRPVNDAVTMLGNTCTPIGMIYIGMTLYRTGRKILIDRGMVVMCLFRIAIAPLLIHTILLLVKPDIMPKTVLMLESAMPVLTQASVVAGLEGADAGYVAQGTVITMILALTITPVITLVAPLL